MGLQPLKHKARKHTVTHTLFPPFSPFFFFIFSSFSLLFFHLTIRSQITVTKNTKKTKKGYPPKNSISHPGFPITPAYPLYHLFSKKYPSKNKPTSDQDHPKPWEQQVLYNNHALSVQPPSTRHPSGNIALLKHKIHLPSPLSLHQYHWYKENPRPKNIMGDDQGNRLNYPIPICRIWKPKPPHAYQNNIQTWMNQIPLHRTTNAYNQGSLLLDRAPSEQSSFLFSSLKTRSATKISIYILSVNHQSPVPSATWQKNNTNTNNTFHEGSDTTRRRGHKTLDHTNTSTINP